MQQAHISEAIAKMIEDKILGEWKHEGYIDKTYSDGVNACIDGKHYLIKLTCYEDAKDEEE